MATLCRVLVPIDLSALRSDAIGQALAFARLLKVEVHLLCVVEPEGEREGPLPFPLVEELSDRMREQVSEYAPASSADIPIRYAVRSRRSEQKAIIEYARDYGIDLIVVDEHVHRRSGPDSAEADQPLQQQAPCTIVTLHRERPAARRYQPGDGAGGAPPLFAAL